jgi:LysM domain
LDLSDWPATPAEGDARDDPEAEATPPDAPGPALPILDSAARSPDPSVCPFFRLELDGVLVAPLLKPDDGNRCVAIGDPRPQSARQQELVCLGAAHADCPRYLRGAMVLGDPASAARKGTVPRATVAALLVLVLSAGISFGFVVQRGGIELPVAAEPPTSMAIALAPPPSADATLAPTVEPTIAPTPSVLPSPSSSPSVAPSPSPSPASPSPSASASVAPTASPTPEPTEQPTPKPTKKPESDRYRLLDPCPNQRNCWIYTVRGGDNLYSIAHYFGHSMTVIYQWNPRYATGARLRAGDQIRMPPPTR